MRIVVLGATSAIGRRVVVRLCDLGHNIVATSRSSERLNLIDPRAETAITSTANAATLTPLLASANRIVNIAHASTIEQLIALVPPTCQRLVVIGSTRRDSKVPNRGADDVRHGEAVFLRSKLPGSMLHPTMIYGGGSKRNVTRVLALVRRWPRWLPLIWPVPDGGETLVQPVYFDDVASAIVAAVTTDISIARTIVVAGPRPFPVAEMLRACASVYGRRLRILSVPTGVLICIVRMISVFSKKGPFSAAELQRSREDKAYDIDALRSQLGVEPLAFSEGIRLLGSEKFEGPK